jgi:hypothetical protein
MKMRSYAAYLRVYEPVTAFHEPDRSRWDAYAASTARPRRRDAMAAEHAEALHRMVAMPLATVPEQESEHAYVRRTGGTVYVCPWQTRLRSLLGCGLAEADTGRGAYIRTSTWSVPLAWFAPFAGAERWIALGRSARVSRGADPAGGAPGAPAPAAATTPAGRGGEPPVRALVYATRMPQARKRAARGLAVLRELGELRDLRLEAELAEVGRWLERFHPYSLVELDYGGLVYLFSDEALRGDESVAELAAAIDGAARGQQELAQAMYARVRARWRTFSEFEQVN